ncbi:MAG: hypothetical protein KDD51_03010 [Bdellovibrionales bacterium]|nr:hypothetical protein [Bdellovibrionales bacterium]
MSQTTHTTKPKAPQKKKWGLLLGLLAIEVILYAVMPKAERDRAPMGYVVKDGHVYTVAWKVSDGQFQLSQFSDLREALHFANKELALYPAHLRPIPARTPLERVWVSDLSGSFTLLWKATNNPFLFKWSFDQERDARYFANAFEAGAYSQSPFGHSLLLVPKATN